jgi:hypothetical protein
LTKDIREVEDDLRYDIEIGTTPGTTLKNPRLSAIDIAGIKAGGIKA